MPRNSQGGYSLPAGTLVASGDTILVSQHNPAMADIEQALGNSLDRKGSGGMLADLPLNGNKIVNVAPGENPTDVATVSQLTTGGAPVGAIMDYAGATAPSGWLLCGGQSLSRTEYADLFAAIGTAFGSADANSFSLPDFRGRVSAGADFSNNGLAGRLSLTSVGAAGGAQTVTLSTDQMPSHTHTGSTTPAGSHSHFSAGFTFTIEGTRVGAGTQYIESDGAVTSVAGEHTHFITMNSSGGGQSHPNVQPTLVLNKIIRTGKN